MEQHERISIVIPVHDEARIIGELVRRCIACTPRLLEVIVVDDGSSDGSAEAARRAGARVERFDVNRGKGVALRRGLSIARGEIVVLVDGDGQDAPEEIPLLLEAIRPDVALVIGSRFLGSFDDGAITRMNRWGTLFLTRVLNTLYGSAITDPIAGFRAVRRRTLEACRLSAERYDIEVDLLLALLARGEKIVEVPVRRAARRHGSTDLVPLHDGARILLRILARRARSS